jgi:hypothetical protein
VAHAPAVLKIRRHIPKPEGDRRPRMSLFTATMVPDVHKFVLFFSPIHEFVDLNPKMRPRQNGPRTQIPNGLND